MIRAALVVLVLLLAGCASGPGLKERVSARMGETELEIVRDFGVPDAVVETEGVRFLRWSRRDVSVYPGGPYWRYGGVLGPSPMVVRRDCDLEIEFRRNTDGDAGAEAPWRAAAWRTRGNDCR